MTNVNLSNIESKLAEARRLMKVYHYREVQPILEDLVETGNAEAQYLLGELYRALDEGNEERQKKAMKLFQLSAEQGNSDAITSLALCYTDVFALISLFNSQKSNELLEKAYSMGNLRALGALLEQKCTHFEWSDRQGANVIIDQLREAAQQGCIQALRILAGIYSNSNYYSFPIEPNFEMEESYYLQAIELGDIESMHDLARSYRLHGNIDKFLELNRKGIEMEDPYAYVQLAFYYVREKSGYSEKALELYEKAYEITGDISILSHASSDFSAFDESSRHLEFSHYLCQKAAIAGDKYMMFQVAEDFETGNGCEKDYLQALDWYTKAASKGDSEAMIKIASFYKEGKGVEIDHKTSLEWYLKASDEGNSKAMMSIAEHYDDGILLKKNPQTASEWYEKAAHTDDSDAQYIMAKRCHAGIGVPKNDEKALEWYQKAAKRNDGYGFDLAKRYLEGNGVPKDKEKAYALLEDISVSSEELLFEEALRYRKGIDVPKDDEIALDLYRINMYFYMQYTLDIIYKDNGLDDQQLFEEKAREYLKQYYTNEEMGGYHSELAAFYETKREDCMTPDYVMAAKHYSIAAEYYDYIPAMKKLSELYHDGLGVEKNQELSDYWSNRAISLQQ